MTSPNTPVNDSELLFSDIVQLVRDELNSHSKDGDIGYNRAAQVVDIAIQSLINQEVLKVLDRLDGAVPKNWDRAKISSLITDTEIGLVNAVVDQLKTAIQSERGKYQ